jgi:hypothetical protein
MADRAGPPTTNLTPVQRRRLKATLAIDDQPTDRIAFQHTVLCQTCLPYRDPGPAVRVWQRQQGSAFLRLEAGAIPDPQSRSYVELGLPYGSRPRLILNHLNSEALKRGTARIDVEHSLTAFIRRIQARPPSGPEIHRFKDQLTRFATCLIRLAVGVADDRLVQVDTKIVDAFELWLGNDDNRRVLWPAVVELSPRYFDSLTRHAIPLDERAIGALANSPLALDAYAWLAQRLHRIPTGKRQTVSWSSLFEQFGCGFARLRDFRREFLTTLRTVQAHYQAARFEVDADGLVLCHSQPPVACRLVVVPRLPG